MGERPITVEQRQWLRQEISEWQRSGLLSEEAAARIADFYVPPQVAAEQKTSRVVYVLMGIAALLVGVAVLLLIGFNEQGISGTTKLILLLGLLGGVYGGGWYLRFHKQERRLSEIALFLGCFLYGAGIWLVQQVFQVSASPTVGLFWWAVGILPFVLLLDTALFHALLVALVALWSLFSDNLFGMLSSSGGNGLDWLPSCLVVLPVALFGLYTGHRQQRPGLISLYLPLLAWWALLSLLQFNGWTVLPSLGIVGAILLHIGGLPTLAEPVRSPYRRYGIVLTGTVLLPLGYYGVTTGSLSDTVKSTVTPGAIVVFGIIVALVLFLIVRQLRSKQDATVWREQALPLLLTLLFGGHLLLHALRPSDPSSAALILSLLSNAASVGLAIWLVQRGLQEERGRTFGFGIFYLLLWICLRYADLFGEEGGLLGAALLFALCAGVLFGVAFYWRSRKGATDA